MEEIGLPIAQVQKVDPALPSRGALAILGRPARQRPVAPAVVVGVVATAASARPTTTTGLVRPAQTETSH